MPQRTDWSKRINRQRLHRTLGLPDKLPAEYSQIHYDVACYAQSQDTSPNIPCAEIHITASGSAAAGRKSSKHRVFIKCKCARLIPVGRYHQHVC